MNRVFYQVVKSKSITRLYWVTSSQPKRRMPEQKKKKAAHHRFNSIERQSIFQAPRFSRKIFVDAQIGVKFNHLIIDSIQSNHSMRVRMWKYIPVCLIGQQCHCVCSWFLITTPKTWLLRMCFIMKWHNNTNTIFFSLAFFYIRTNIFHMLKHLYIYIYMEHTSLIFRFPFTGKSLHYTYV